MMLFAVDDGAILGLLFAIAIAALFGGWGGRIAGRKGRNTTVWTIVCFFTGLLGIIIVAFVPKTAARKAEEVQEYAKLMTTEPAPPTWTEELRKLGELHDAGTLTDAEFQSEKERVLAAHR